MQVEPSSAGLAAVSAGTEPRDTHRFTTRKPGRNRLTIRVTCRKRFCAVDARHRRH